MHRQRYIVDGYNLAHKLPELKRLVSDDTARARDRLVLLLADYAARRNVSVTVVFDGVGERPPGTGRAGAGASVVFAGSDADSYIKRMLERERSPKSCVVVTSDNSIRLHVADFGARLIRSEEFAAEIGTAGRSQRPKGKVQGDGRGPDKPEPGRDSDWQAVKDSTKRIVLDTWTPPPPKPRKLRRR